AKKDWDTDIIQMRDAKGKPILYDMKKGRQCEMDLETSMDDFSSGDSSTTSEEESTVSEESDSSIEVMGIILKDPKKMEQHDFSSSNQGETLGIQPLVEARKLHQMLSSELCGKEREDYILMLSNFTTLFIDEYDKITGIRVVQQHIKLKEGSKLVVQKLRRLGVIQEALLKEVRKLLEAGFIYLVEDSQWVSPVVVTPKKNGKWRVCVDYKPLNAGTKRDHFSLPFQEEILNEVAGHECYTVCDGYSGYFQIGIALEDQLKTTFITPWGCYAFRVMPFGLTNAPPTFQRFMNM
ncbi:reverse transcriptase family protein, partial [Enterobacter cloacae complex sp. 2DZ2F2B]|uniref:reverse transcriptase family protein n=1 Tax=Enterobacter cloacae complex sp. 2DZ2F2B TaxID=2511984 RepID=UPI001025FBF9